MSSWLNSLKSGSLVNMVLCSNVSELQFLSTIFSLDLPKQINMFEFVNTIMDKIYKLLFDDVYQGC